MEINKDTEELSELESKIAARNTSIAYQENTLRRMRETVNRLRFVEAEIRESFDRHYAEGGAPSSKEKEPFLPADDLPLGSTMSTFLDPGSSGQTRDNASPGRRSKGSGSAMSV